MKTQTKSPEVHELKRSLAKGTRMCAALPKNWKCFGDPIAWEDYLKGEVRFASVAKQFPKEADELFAAAQENAQWRYKSYLRMLGTQW